MSLSLSLYIYIYPWPQTTANLRTKILDFGRFDSSRILVLKGRMFMSIGNLLQSSGQEILKLDKHSSIEQFEPTVSHSTVSRRALPLLHPSDHVEMLTSRYALHVIIRFLPSFALSTRGRHQHAWGGGGNRELE